MTRNDFGTHYQNVEIGRERGLEAVYALVSSQDDWDRYEGLQWYAAETWASDNRDDPDDERAITASEQAIPPGRRGKTPSSGELHVGHLIC